MRIGRSNIVQMFAIVALGAMAHEASVYSQCSTIISHEEHKCFPSAYPCNTATTCTYPGQPCFTCSQSHARSTCVPWHDDEQCVELTIYCPENSQGCGYEVVGSCTDIGGGQYICDSMITSNPCVYHFKYCS